MPVYVVLLGPPGAGKGTQAQRIAGELNLPHISSGEIFREHLKDQTELGSQAQEFIKRGELVPDELTIAMVKERLLRADCHDGALLDGFPRTPTQAEALEKLVADLQGEVTCVPYIKVAVPMLVERLSGRRTCPACGRVYHPLYNPPQTDGKCDDDGALLYQREDDKPETVRNRIDVYFQRTTPLIDFYRNAGLLVEVDGSQEIEEVASQLLRVIRSR